MWIIRHFVVPYKDEICLVFTEKKIFLFFFSVKGKHLLFFPSHFSLILHNSALLVDIILGVNPVCT